MGRCINANNKKIGTSHKSTLRLQTISKTHCVIIIKKEQENKSFTNKLFVICIKIRSLFFVVLIEPISYIYYNHSGHFNSLVFVVVLENERTRMKTIRFDGVV